MRPGREADNLPQSSGEFKNAWSYTSTPQYVFMAWCLVKHRTTLPCRLSLKLARPVRGSRETLTHLTTIDWASVSASRIQQVRWSSPFTFKPKVVIPNINESDEMNIFFLVMRNEFSLQRQKFKPNHGSLKTGNSPSCSMLYICSWYSGLNPLILLTQNALTKHSEISDLSSNFGVLWMNRFHFYHVTCHDCQNSAFHKGEWTTYSRQSMSVRYMK